MKEVKEITKDFKNIKDLFKNSDSKNAKGVSSCKSLNKFIPNYNCLEEVCNFNISSMFSFKVLIL